LRSIRFIVIASTANLHSIRCYFARGKFRVFKQPLGCVPQRGTKRATTTFFSHCYWYPNPSIYQVFESVPE
jgi:hypothetical protein